MAHQNASKGVVRSSNCSQTMVTDRRSAQKRTSRYYPYTCINCELHGAKCPHEAIDTQPSLSRGPTHTATHVAFAGHGTSYNQHVNQDVAFSLPSLEPTAFHQHHSKSTGAPSRKSAPTTSPSRLSQVVASPRELRLTGEKEERFSRLSEVNRLLVLRAGDDEQSQSDMLTWVNSIVGGKDRPEGPVVVSKKKPKKGRTGEMLLGCKICGFTNRSTSYEEIVDHIILLHTEWRTGYPCIFSDCPSATPPFCQGPHDLCLHLRLFHDIPVNHDASEVLCCLTAPLLHKPVDHRNFCILSIAPSPQVTYPYPCTLQEVSEHQRAVECYGGTGENKEYTTRWINAFYLSYGRLPMKILFKGTLKKDGSPRKKQGVEHVGCVICGEPGQDLEEIMPHIISNHIMSAGFACKTCPKVFYRRGDLGRHRKEDHNEVIDKSTEMDEFINWDA
ncbi:hypothetical protein FS842_000887 [Serendipita sp. 407]|nr:hypothetical protein FS842_000887 [Serendipita sp. 407]